MPPRITLIVFDSVGVAAGASVALGDDRVGARVAGVVGAGVGGTGVLHAAINIMVINNHRFIFSSPDDEGYHKQNFGSLHDFRSSCVDAAVQLRHELRLRHAEPLR